MNAEFVQIHTEYGIDAKVGFHCVLSDGSYLLTIFNGTVSGLSLVRMSDGVVTNEVLAGAQYKGSDAAIVPEFSTTTISFSGHVIDPCYDLSQNFVFNLSEFSLKFVNSTGGDVPDCQANI
jgi:hypothetical protein